VSVVRAAWYVHRCHHRWTGAGRRGGWAGRPLDQVDDDRVRDAARADRRDRLL